MKNSKKFIGKLYIFQHGVLLLIGNKVLGEIRIIPSTHYRGACTQRSYFRRMINY